MTGRQAKPGCEEVLQHAHVRATGVLDCRMAAGASSGAIHKPSGAEQQDNTNRPVCMAVKDVTTSQLSALLALTEHGRCSKRPEHLLIVRGVEGSGVHVRLRSNRREALRMCTSAFHTHLTAAMQMFQKIVAATQHLPSDISLLVVACNDRNQTCSAAGDSVKAYHLTMRKHGWMPQCMAVRHVRTIVVGSRVTSACRPCSTRTTMMDVSITS